MTRKKVLFFAEPATLAHVARPVVLANSLDRQRYEVVVATGPDFRPLVSRAGLTLRDLHAIGTRAYLASVASGRPVYSFSVLEEYVRDDLRHIEEFRPDLIVGDFRLSLAVSARLSSVPYWIISNAYWSPFTPVSFDMPAHPITGLVGVHAAKIGFRLFRPLIFAYHSLPMHRLRRRYGMRSLGLDLRSTFSEADRTLFADVPELVPTSNVEPAGRYLYIGPITWSPGGPLPPELSAYRDRPPLVYVALGSSGDSRVLDRIVGALVRMKCRVVVAVGSEENKSRFAAGVIAADYLPGEKVSRLADLVICNGGSPSTHQALLEGTPVLGIPSNLDQLLNMHFVTVSGAGLALRADECSEESVRDSVERLLSTPSFRQSAERVASWLRGYVATERFAELVQKSV